MWRDPDGKRVIVHDHYTEPDQLARPVPTACLWNNEEQWLDVSRTPFVKAQSLLKPYPEDLMDAHDVSPIVNSAKYEGPECIQPVSDDEIPGVVDRSVFTLFTTCYDLSSSRSNTTKQNYSLRRDFMRSAEVDARLRSPT